VGKWNGNGKRKMMGKSWFSGQQATVYSFQLGQNKNLLLKSVSGCCSLSAKYFA